PPEPPLAMRRAPTTGRPAADLLAGADERELHHTLGVYGEERFAGRIAAAVVRRRKTAPLVRTGALVELVRENIPHAPRRTGGNPAKRTFQALRIAVNAELEALGLALTAAPPALARGGRRAVAP